MSRSRSVTAFFAVALLAGNVPSLASGVQEPERPAPAGVILEEMFKASGVEEPDELAEFRQAAERAIAALVDDLGHQRPGYRRARRLHRKLHKRFLRVYDVEADGLQQILTRGRFNCLSATLFYGLVARELGYRPIVVETPGHLFLRLRINERIIDVEATAVEGFDVYYGFQHRAGSPWEPRAPSGQGVDESAARRYGDSTGPLWLVSLHDAVGFAWLNRAWRLLDDGDHLRAARAVVEAERHLPDLAGRAPGVDRLLARAFMAAYERVHFDDAYRIAAVGLGLYPDSTTSRDRLLAAALKRIEIACEADVPLRGVAILDEVAKMSVSAADLMRLERSTCPLIAATAVRLGDWNLARMAAERYAAAERDPVEAARLASWVEYRSLQDRSADAPACFEPALGPPRPAVSY